MSDHVEMELHGPLSWLEGDRRPCVFESPLANLSGVYVWSVSFQQTQMVYYVGETGRSFASRLREHLMSYVAGWYRIWEPELFARGEKILIWEGMWRPGQETRMREFIARQAVLAPKIQRLLEMFSIHLAALEVAPRLRERIEAALAAALRAQGGVAGRFQDEDIRYRPRTVDEPAVHVRLKSTARIMGLPGKLAA